MERNALGPAAGAVLPSVLARADAAPRLGRADLTACREVLRRLAVAFGAGGRPDRAGPLLDAAEVLRDLLERPEAPVRPGRVPHRVPHPEGTRCGTRRGLVGAGVGRRTLGTGWPTDA